MGLIFDNFGTLVFTKFAICNIEILMVSIVFQNIFEPPYLILQSFNSTTLRRHLSETAYVLPPNFYIHM